MTDYPPLTPETPFPFGKNKGVPLGEMPPDYLAWFISVEWSSKYPDLVEYAKKALDPDQPEEPPEKPPEEEPW